MLKKLIFLIVLIAFASTTIAISFDFNESKAGKEKQLSGNVILSEGVYNKDSAIKVSINSVSKEKQMQQLINCTAGCEERSSEYYVYTGATAAEISSSNFLTGIKLAKGATISIDAKFNISNADANYPDTPMVDVGNDGVIEWKFQGKAPASIDWNVNSYKGPEINAVDATELNLDSIGTCQQIFLNKSDTFRISSTLRKSITSPPSLGIYLLASLPADELSITSDVVKVISSPKGGASGGVIGSALSKELDVEIFYVKNSSTFKILPKDPEGWSEDSILSIEFGLGLRDIFW